MNSNIFILSQNPDWLLLLCRAELTNQALVDKEETYYYLPLTSRVFLPPPLSSAVQFCMSRAVMLEWNLSQKFH